MPAKTHGLSRKIPEYRAWINMKSRCFNPATPEFDRYGGRGITVCDKWANSFEAFFADVGARPSPKHSLDRWPDPDGDYEPNNVRWATQQQQCRNFATFNKIIVCDGREMTLAEAIERSPLKYNTVLYRIRRGWTIENALTLDPQKGVRP